MFKLQRLEITGFKSFADHTEIVFTGNGITGVVGPNGCGKSNVSDAMSWVLGEQRAKSLRGGEMKDVVFQGSRNRKPGGMAEVVLHMVRDEDFQEIPDGELEEIDSTLSEIDEQSVDMAAIEGEPEEELEAVAETNGFHPPDGEIVEEAETALAAQVGSIQTVETKIRTKRHWRPRAFALDFAPGEAVSVTRRLYLSGESEYELNGKTCRLRDIQDLFAGTGLSGAHYAIIEQGRIGQILSAKPADRRNLIEEAAGISKFRTRQRAAESRLDTAKSNLGRVSDIVSEIEKQANSLRRQASKTRRYKILQEEFRVLLRQLFAAEGRHLTHLVGELETQLRGAAELEIRLAEEVTAKEGSVRDATQIARLAESTLAEIREAHSQNALIRDRAEREHRYKEEQVMGLDGRIEALRYELKTIKERLDLVREERAKLEGDEEKERAEASQAELSLREAEDKQKGKLEHLNEIETSLNAARAELMQHISASERFDEIARQLEHNLEKLSDRAEGLKRESIRAEETHLDHISQAGAMTEQLGLDKAKLTDLHAERQSLMDETAAARQAVRLAEEKLKQLAGEFAQKKNRLETLRELEETKAIYVPQVQKLFARQDDIGVRLSGVLADRLNVSESAEKAVENLFGPYLQTVLVDSSEDASRVSVWLHSNDIGRVGILVAPGEGSALAINTGGSTIADHLGISASFASVLRAIFPREMNARLVDSLDAATAEDGEIVVSRAGDLLLGGKLLVSGKAAPNEKNASLLAFKREMQTLGVLADQLSGDVAVCESNCDSTRSLMASKEESMVDLQSVIIKVERGIHGLEIQQTAARQEIERAERHKRVVAAEIDLVAGEIAELTQLRTDAIENSGQARSAKQTIEDSLERIGIEHAAARTAFEEETAGVNEKRTFAATSDERRRSVLSALRRVENEEKELDGRISSLTTEVESSEAKVEELRASIADIVGSIASASEDQEREESELAEALLVLEKARVSADGISEELARANHASADARNEKAAIEIGQAETVTRLQNIEEKCLQDLNLALAELVSQQQADDEFELESGRAEANHLRERLENFGAINMLALEELAEAEERLLFLTSQRQDIIDSIAATEEALREIKERSRERFRRAFEAINENFTQFFQELFGGGRGEMTLLEADDILEAGIEVVAQPPGKRLQNILLLSGGEKAMTAISLVLAIFKYRPSPFCLLDEVDAPLDDANVGRFVDKIAEMSEKTQFIVITHNKRTMEAARALYGVTMQEAGVSKVVSVKFE
ncbi:MAG: chromosome segregation protein SMC [Acidobacteriota bacterium]